MFMQPSSNSKYPKEKYDWVNAADVQHIRSEGLKVIPIFSNYTYQEIDFLLSKVNGVYFPGGDADLWLDVQQKEGFTRMTNTAQQFNEKGDYFPLWGTCLGFQLMSLGFTNYEKILDDVKDQNNTKSGNIIALKGKMFEQLDENGLFSQKNLINF
ncbi:hypothetical protein IMG5_202990 [Ichthyophthirius multifiliis]|uniref:folate gamma-glutamyl hydrolase n=1 Tax=Ichthyophthirius multifiliis TaxID=5932 RepID=G0R688_ICHMU|nr:hypothetical protein IMG5_202990 [Ichthyophthirius multifiliis]EGR27015.1 hypothetical protein IMG5_202990 [Ichthyophthirius multifiliis]|eukprot:XP_004023899.1 hypothetical protein IMG5_202990 [Ichthyophthirius multifiliis]